MDLPHHGSAIPRVVGSLEPCLSCDARATSICSAIDHADLERLAKVALPMRVQAGQTFVYEGDPADSFFNITEGTARLFKLLPDGRRQITGFARTGHFLGLAVRDAYTFGAEAIEPVNLCRFSRGALRALLDDFPAMERRLLETATNELASAQEQMLLLGRKTARERLASFLVAQARAAHACDRHVTRLRLPMTRGDIADYLGLTIETVSRTFTKLKTEHLIELPGPHEVAIRNFAGLESIAGGLDE
jgi:CRP/FNR family transcriptional regulator